MSKRLTAATVEHLKPDPKGRLELPDEAVRGLYFVIQPTGAKSWAFRYRAAGRPTKLTLGAYPALGLGEARAAAKVAREAVDRGKDPAGAKSEMRRRRKEGSAAIGSVQRVYEQFIKKRIEGGSKPNKPRSAEETKRIFTKRVLPVWGERQIRDITKRDVRELVERIEEEGAPIAAKPHTHRHQDTLQLGGKAEELDANPASGVDPVAKERVRDRVLSDEEIAAFWHATKDLGPPLGSMMRILLLTGQRRSEVADMRDDEINDGVWVIPGSRTKNSRPNALPLPTAVMKELEAVPRIGDDGWVFSTTGKTPVSGFSNARDAVDKRMLIWLKQQAESGGRSPDAVSLKPWRPHDLRRTAATGMARLGVAPHVVEAVLNHKTGQITKIAGVYNIHDYLPEKSQALELWAAHVLQLVGEGPAAGNVIALRERLTKLPREKKARG